LKQHAEARQPAVLLLHPFYVVFYALFQTAFFALIFNAHSGTDGTGDKAADAFGFIFDSTLILTVMAFTILNMVIAIGFAFWMKRIKHSVSPAELKNSIINYSFLALTISVFAVVGCFAVVSPLR
jgi:hypothetical protein